MPRLALIGSTALCIAVSISLGTPSRGQTLAVQPASVPATDYQPVTLSPEQAQADIALMRRGLEMIHPGLYRYRTHAEIAAAFSRLNVLAQTAVTDLQLWRAIALMLAEIHCDHTKPEASDAIEHYRLTHATHLPIRFKIIEGRMITVSNDGQPGAPPPGAEIIAINGMPVPVVLTTLGKTVAYDGTTDQSIAAKLSSDGDLMGDDFNEYWPALYGFPTAWTLDWKRVGDLKISHASLTPTGFKAWIGLTWPGGPYGDEFYRSIRWRIAGQTAYWRIDTFVNYRNPVDATAFLDSFFKRLKTDGVANLILDLRENGGGSEDVSVALGRYLLRSRFTWSKPVLLKAVRYGDLPAHMASWGDPKALFEPPLDRFRRTADGWWERLPHADKDDDDESVLPQDVSPDRFTGHLTILTGPRNGSGATRTIAVLKEKLGATLVGEDSAGSAEGPTAGHIFLMTLPNSGLKVRIPNAWNRTNIDHFVQARGVAVDDRVTPTLADFDAGVDRALDVAKGTPTSPPPDLAQALSGAWTGTLNYRDFGDNRRVILPTGMTGAADSSGATLAFTFDDGPGKTVRSTEHWSMSADGKNLLVQAGKETEVMAIVERRGGAATEALTLVAEGHGQDNGLPVSLRTILTRRGETLSIARLTQRPGEPFLLRHAYEIRRAR
jgi:hypothetical protein